MFEIRFIVRTRSEKDHGGIRPLRRSERQQRFTLDVEEPGQLPHVTLIESTRQRACTDQAILQRVSHSRRRLCAVRNHPPAAVRSARDIHGVTVQVRSTWRAYSKTRPQEMRVRIHERRWQASFVK